MDGSQSGSEHGKPEPPEWLRQMWDHYRETGGIRGEDLRRICGDVSQPVQMRYDPDGTRVPSNSPLFG